MIRRSRVVHRHHRSARWIWACLAVLAAFPLSAEAQEIGRVVVVAGVGGFADPRLGLFGDGGPALAAVLRSPGGLAVDGAGSIYIADAFDNRVRKVTPDGTIVTVAGSGRVGLGSGSFSGDGGLATQAALNLPSDVAVDSAGNLYIADWLNHRVRKVSRSGIITTVAGSGGSGAPGDSGPTTQAEVSGPLGLAVDSRGNLFIADLVLSCVHKINPEGKISVVAGGGTAGPGDGGPATAAQLKGPSGVAVDAAGNLFIAERNHNRVRKVDARGTITTVAGTGEAGFSGDGGPATAARLNFPTGLALDRAGSVFVVDWRNHRVRKVSPDGTITTVVGGGAAPLVEGVQATAAAFRPAGLAADSLAVDNAGDLLISDGATHRIVRVRNVAAHSLPAEPAAPAEPEPLTHGAR